MVRKYERARRSVIEQAKDATDFPALVEETTGPLRRRPSGLSLARRPQDAQPRRLRRSCPLLQLRVARRLL